MKRRTTLLFAYVGVVLALGVLGAWSARTLSQISVVSGRIIAENSDSVVAAQDMRESLERQDSAALFDLLGQRDRARRQANEQRARFNTALNKAAANITEVGEREALDMIRIGRAEYDRRFDAFLNASGDRTPLYFQSLEPQFNRVRDACDFLLRLKPEALKRQADDASQSARRRFSVTFALAIALMAAGVAVAARLSRTT